MKDIAAFLTSGIIELYCLGLASEAEAEEVERLAASYPEINEEIEKVFETLENYARVQSIPPPPDLKNRILQSLENEQLASNGVGGFDTFAELGDHPDPAWWEARIKHIKAPDHLQNIHHHSLYKDSKKFLAVVWVQLEVPMERHDDLQEKILILEGSCKCLLDGEWYNFTAGDLVTVPLHKDHNLIVTSDQPVKLILSRVRLAS